MERVDEVGRFVEVSCNKRHTYEHLTVTSMADMMLGLDVSRLLLDVSMDTSRSIQD
jgi:hypothetical protein